MLPQLHAEIVGGQHLEVGQAGKRLLRNRACGQ
jgi:hypothetical protein